MREIKFRAWDKKTSRIYQVNHIYKLSNSNEICVWTNEIEGGYHFNQSSLEQYTGLHDKNGREIYEGDIVALTDSSYMDENIQYEQVYYNEKSELVAGKVYLSKVYFNVEVIGNIHENSELLEEK